MGDGDDIASVPDRGGVYGVGCGQILLEDVAFVADIQRDLVWVSRDEGGVLVGVLQQQFALALDVDLAWVDVDWAEGVDGCSVEDLLEWDPSSGE